MLKVCGIPIDSKDKNPKMMRKQKQNVSLTKIIKTLAKFFEQKKLENATKEIILEEVQVARVTKMLKLYVIMNFQEIIFLLEQNEIEMVWLLMIFLHMQQQVISLTKMWILI